MTDEKQNTATHAQRGRRGGNARASKLSPKERSAIASAAAKKRWAAIPAEERSIVKATHSGELHIGSISIPCYVLEDGRRVLSGTGVLNTLSMSHGGRPGFDGDRLSRFVAGKGVNPFVSSDLATRIAKPLLFLPVRAPGSVASGGSAMGYDATILADICEAVLDARNAGALQKQQLHIAKQCEILIRAFSRVGIVALVDEATGYQTERDREELHRFLSKYIAEELLPWTKMFPDSFYQQMFRLNGWSYSPASVKRPQVVGKFTHDIVYARLPPGVLEELKVKNPVLESGHRKHKHHQFLTQDVGHPALKSHLIGVITLMRASTNWQSFKRLLERVYPTKNQIDLPLPEN